jgi:hypothetical protein
MRCVKVSGQRHLGRESERAYREPLRIVHEIALRAQFFESELFIRREGLVFVARYPVERISTELLSDAQLEHRNTKTYRSMFTKYDAILSEMFLGS